jgi:carbonic anhydrase
LASSQSSLSYLIAFVESAMIKHICSRRQLLASAGATGLVASSTFATEPPADEPTPKDPSEALARLKAGNARFAAGTTRHAHESADWRKHLTAGQTPFATILGCSDSRVPIELVFDQGFGDLFVIRVAGNVVAADVLGSVAYAALHLRTSLFVVMGHTGCGAVTAALDEKLNKLKEPEQIEALLRLVNPALKDIDPAQAYSAQLNAAVEANVRWSMKQLVELPGAKAALRNHSVMLVGAVYDLATGTVGFLDP